MKIAITGHRPNKLGNDYDLKSDLVQKIRFQLQHIITLQNVPGANLTLITGMALGIDTLFALLAIENKLPFIAAIPCRQQYSKWPQKSRELWMDITDNELCDKYYVSEDFYTPDCMQKRNVWMVDKCDILIAVWDESPGGTANCVQYAKEQLKPIIHINPKSL